ncbi:MAG: type II secretion system secretin GspD [Oxalobacteraceae bacterium]|jgi:general secretion pathway protein D|nr:type II secretion system secretin GspD [Oxalobacteraceae bacterium]
MIVERISSSLVGVVPCYFVDALIIFRTRSLHARLVDIALMLLLLFWLQTAKAQDPASNQANLNFVGADIEAVVRAIGHYTGNTFVIDPRVKGTINLISEKPVSKSQALEMLSSVLRLQGFSVVSTPDYVKVVPEAEAKLQAGPVQAEKEKLRGDQIVTRVFHLNHESASGLINVLRPLIAPNNTIAADPTNNTLIITDYADNLKRLARIIASVDTPAIGELDVIKLEHAIASDLTVTANRLLDSGGGQGTIDPARVLLLADTRTNSVILRAPTQARANLARTLIAKLDQPTLVPGNVHVVYLRNAEATKLAQVLRAVVASEMGAAATTPGAVMQPAVQPATQTPTQQGAGMQMPPSSPAPMQGPLPIGGATGFIQADPTTNTLIITANERVYRNVRAIIDQLDARRAQVYVESLIIEVSADKAAQFGIQWAGVSGDTGSNVRVGVLTGFSSEGNNLVSQAASVVGTSKAPLPPGNGLTALLFKQTNGGLQLGMLARALEKNVKANILSMPNLITLDNEEARIIVGQNVPFITGQFTTAASGGTAGVNPFQTIERRDIGLSLRVRPQISEGGTVRMAIYQETSNIQQSTVSGLITSKRSIDTNVLVDDGQIIVLGGLIEDTVNDTVEKIPLLGDIPFLGYFFRYQSKQRGKTNLMVFLRPTVIRNESQSVAVASDRYDYIRGAQLGVQPEQNVFLPRTDTPALPPLQQGRPQGGNLLRRDFNEPERGPQPVSPSPSSGSSAAPVQPNTPAEVFPIEPPVIDLR